MRRREDLRVGLVGAGGIARVHAENLRTLEGVRVAAVMDVAIDRAERLADACGARAVAAMAPLLDEVDAVYVCSPPTLHREHVVQAASAGKHVFCEKPLATTLEDGRVIVDALTAAPVKATVGFNNRFRRSFRRLRDLVRDGDLGVPLSGWIVRLAPSMPPTSNWRTTPGLLCGITIESASHDIDLVRWALGEVIAVAGSTASSLPDLDGYDDTLNALLWLDSRVSVSLLISWSSAISTASRGVVGTAGSACLEGPDMWNISRLRWARPGQSETIEELDHRDGADLGYRAETEHFIDCLRQDRAPDVTVADGLAALEVSLALKSSAQSGQAAVPASTVPWPHRV